MRKEIKELIHPHEVLVIVRIQKTAFGRTNKHWMIASKAHGEQIFKPGTSRKQALEGFLTCSGFEPKKIVRYVGVLTPAEAAAHIIEELRYAKPEDQ